ncbi:hypothetical protein [Natrialbaceae archaeon AArc-T1-2]|uniref:hypothetical protein n=1 Tax=Natrialbaceae archaeon AArc-T1-2 TaxID=3053904 RepID=UPI00255B09BA|nr:hypothetical protein [Natrialbaceae archaeon AArc-T1-2]WIV68827.1 hypothetical protein QQ977_16105 [Natrialbaceae archaeon AArc-T1-2]
MNKIIGRANEVRKDKEKSLFRAGLRFGARTVKRNAYSIRKNFHKRLKSESKWTVGKTLYPLENQDPNWTYHTEDWERVVNRWEHRRALREGRSLTVLDNTQHPKERLTWDGDDAFSVDVPAGKEDRWVYLYLDRVEHSWRNFQWEFVVSRESQFKELQFGFRYHDFYNRYRFRHQDNHFHYDIVLNGDFHNSLNKTPCVMSNNEEHHVVIQSIENEFILKVDGEVLLKDIDFSRYFRRGSCAIILWEDDDVTPIQAKLHSMKVQELVEV